MPIEAVTLEKLKPPVSRCIYCGGEIKAGTWDQPSTLWMRGQVQRSRRKWWPPFRKRPYCAVICPHCRRRIGWEDPHGKFVFSHRKEKAIFDVSGDWPEEQP